VRASIFIQPTKRRVLGSNSSVPGTSLKFRGRSSPSCAGRETRLPCAPAQKSIWPSFTLLRNLTYVGQISQRSIAAYRRKQSTIGITRPPAAPLDQPIEKTNVSEKLFTITGPSSTNRERSNRFANNSAPPAFGRSHNPKNIRRPRPDKLPGQFPSHRPHARKFKKPLGPTQQRSAHKRRVIIVRFSFRVSFRDFQKLTNFRVMRPSWR